MKLKNEDEKDMSNKIVKVRFSSQSFDDLDEIFDHLAEFDIDAGNKLIGELMKKFRLLGENPKIGVLKDGLIIGLRLFPHKNYNIFYFQTEFGVEIYRVLHSSRDNVQVIDDVIDEIN
jgi:toxin ParE1/3/4